MLKLNKKGFTIVELVIVIAVVAILAAVLIPTFVGLTRAANASADIQACRQMNTQLAINEVTKGKTIVDVYDALEAAGMTAKDYHPLVADTYFFWDSELNRVLYADKDNKVIYPEEYTSVKSKSEDEDGGHQWYSLSGLIYTGGATIRLPDTVETGETLTLDISSAADLVKAAEFARTNKAKLKNKQITISIKEDINLNGADICFVDENKSDCAPVVTINGDNNTITGLYISDKHSGQGYGADGTASSNYGAALFGWVNGLTVENLTIDSAVVGTYEKAQSAIFASHVSGDVKISNVTIKNSSVYGENKIGLLFGYVTKDGYNVSISNVTIENSKVYTKGGEAGLLFGVVTGSSDKQTTLTGCSISITDTVIKDSEVVIKSDAVVENVDGEECVWTTSKYRQARAKYGFYGLNQHIGNAQKTVGEKTVTNWKAINDATKDFSTTWNRSNP